MLTIVFRNWAPLTSRLRQTKGAAFRLSAAVKSRIAWTRCAMLAKLAPARAFRLKIPNQISTWLSQLAEVGVKWKVTFGWAANQSSFFLWVERLSRMTWISRSGGCSATRSVMKAWKSTRFLVCVVLLGG